MGYGGVGEQGGGFGGEADTGGVAEGSSGNSSSGGGRGGNLGSEMGTVGPGQGYGSGHSSTDGSAGGGGRGSGTSNNGYGDTFGDSLDARSAAPEAKAGSSMTGMAAMVSMDDAAKEAKASFGGWASQVDAQMGTQNVGYGALSDSAYGRATAPSISPAALTSALQVAGLPEQMAIDARPSALTRGLSLAATVANPVAGLLGTALNTHTAARNAQASIGAINDAFGTSLDDSYGTALGQQAVGTAAGTLGGKVGGKFGSSIGMSVAGVPGAIGAGLLGSALASNTARGLAMSPNSTTEGPQGPAAGADGVSGLSNAPSSTVASAPSTPKSGYVSIDNYAMDSDRNPFDRYSDYAAQFFGTA